jgi:hypothetical protein
MPNAALYRYGGTQMSSSTAISREPKAAATININAEHNLTVAEFCECERISKYTFYKLKKMRLAPATLWILGTARITPEARRDWREMMQRRQQQAAVKLERERRVKIASVAGKISAASPLHASKTQAIKKRQRKS